jgi:hypothetical protein
MRKKRPGRKIIVIIAGPNGWSDKAKSRKVVHWDTNVRKELRALRRTARNAKRLAEITGTPFIIVKNGKIIDLHKGRKQTAKQRELIRLMRPFGI